jgi:flagellar biosynthesis protein FlgN
MPLNCNHLHAILAAENETLCSFLDVLRGEQTTLIKGKIDQLGASVEPKAQLILELAKLSEQRLQILRHCGMAPNRAGMEQLLNEHYAGEGEETEQWEILLQRATAANQINISNGLMISARMKATQRALSTLTSAACLPAAYTSSGGTVGYHATRQIAVA